MLQDKNFDFGIVGTCLLQKLDEYSFSVYLAHTTCLRIFATLRGMFGLHPILVGGFSLISTVVLTWALHNLVEIPFGKKE